MWFAASSGRKFAAHAEQAHNPTTTDVASNLAEFMTD
jgi:hypothetical protein